MADALEAWVEMKSPTWAVSSKCDQIGRANALKDDPIGKISVARLGVEDVDKWIARRRKQDKGEGTIRNQLQVLRSALRQAERRGWIADKPGYLLAKLALSAELQGHPDRYGSVLLLRRWRGCSRRPARPAPVDRRLNMKFSDVAASPNVSWP